MATHTSTSKATPGPWRWDENRRERKYADLVLTACEDEDPLSIIEGAYLTCETDDENEANARPIAAAPAGLDLAKAVVIVVPMLKPETCTEETRSALIRQALDFIAKTEGRE